ncbi:MAG: S-methyl-5-thioribose-1-phosphate isomerase [Pseudomonadota bacterium]|nr:S-methyl-5-thioribose-1-phosphate isomerase [Pseudomonadota bacterium]
MKRKLAAEIRTICWERGKVVFIDQRLLPDEERHVAVRDYREVVGAIRELAVRGAPAIGVAAALGIALGMKASRATDLAALDGEFAAICGAFAAARPTARNLFWAVERMQRRYRAAAPPEKEAGARRPAVAALKKREGFPAVRRRLQEALVAEAQAIWAEDMEINRSIGAHGADLLAAGDNVLTHCNAGALATAGYGTALGVIRAAWEQGKDIHVYVDETRPVLQGARLTAWELKREGVPATLITDSMAGFLMQRGKIQKIVVGADRIAANGDTANKIGTYSLAVLARAHRIPFYVAAPLSTFDVTLETGREIPIEERAPEEVTTCRGVVLAPRGIDVYNPAFDVTPGRYIAAFVTEKGLLRPPFRSALRPFLRS